MNFAMAVLIHKCGRSRDGSACDDHHDVRCLQRSRSLDDSIRDGCVDKNMAARVTIPLVMVIVI